MSTCAAVRTGKPRTTIRAARLRAQLRNWTKSKFRLRLYWLTYCGFLLNDIHCNFAGCYFLLHGVANLHYEIKMKKNNIHWIHLPEDIYCNQLKHHWRHIQLQDKQRKGVYRQSSRLQILLTKNGKAQRLEGEVQQKKNWFTLLHGNKINLRRTHFP